MVIDTVGTWYSPLVDNISKSQKEDNSIDRYKRLKTLSTMGIGKLQFMRQDLMEVRGPYEVFYVTAKYECRPDLLAFELYGSSLYAWCIMSVNHFKTIYEMVAGTYIHVPLLSQVLEVN